MRLLDEVQSGSRGIGLEVCARAIAFNGIAPFGDLPFELGLGQIDGLREVDFDAVSGSLDIADVHHAGERRRPEARNRAAAGIEREIVAGALVDTSAAT